MSETITVSGRSSNTIAAEIVAITNQTKQMVVMSAIEVGKRLEEAKALVGHGEWGAFLERECLLSPRSANNCMRLFREWRDNPNSQALANISYTNAIRLLSLPEEEREELMQKHDVSQMSSRKLDEVIKERNELQAANETADAKILELEQKLMDAEARAGAAKTSEASWQEEINKLNENLAKAREDATKANNQAQSLRDNPTIPKSMKDKLVKDAKEQGFKDASSSMQAQLDEAKKKAQEAVEAQAAAEKDAQEVRAQLIAMKNQAVFADPDAAEFKVLFNQLQIDFNKLTGLLMKMINRNAEQGEKFKNALRVVVEDMKGKVA